VEGIETNTGKEMKLVKKSGEDGYCCRQSVILCLQHICNSRTMSRVHKITVYKAMLTPVWM
jgi:hypothetical protein